MNTLPAPVRLPQVSAPPHDPKALLLAPWVGPEPLQGWRWARLRGTELSQCGGALQLAATPDTARRLTEASGSFGGLRLPPHMAISASGAVLLLDRSSAQLKLFDACECRFVTLPCGLRADPDLAHADDAGLNKPLPGRLAALNLLAAPSAIACREDRLFIADAGHARVLVYSLAGFVPRMALALPPAERAALAAAGQAWQPADLALDSQGRLWALDAAHSRIDHFDTSGRWLGTLATPPGAAALLLDCHDRAIVITRSLQAITLPALTAPMFAEFDAGAPQADNQTDWQSLNIDGLTAGDLFDVAVVSAAEPLGAAQLALLPAQEWRGWAVKFDNTRAGKTSALALDAGRVLRLRVTPHTGAPALLLTAQSAQAWRLGAAAPEPLDLRTALLQAPTLPAAQVALQVDSSGRFFALCIDSCAPANASAQWRAFDTRGEPLTNAKPPVWRYKRSGTARTLMLDSGIDGCQWHRVDIRGHVPSGCAVRVRSTSASISLTEAEIQTLDDSAWCSTGNSHGADNAGHRDELLMSPPGRYLWLELSLQSDGLATPCIDSLRVEYPRISLRRYLPSVFGKDPVGANFTDRFTALFDATLRSVERPLDRLPSYFEPLATPSGGGDPGRDFLSWLASWVGQTFVRELPETQRRWMLKRLSQSFAQRGTRAGLHQQLLVLLGFDRALTVCSDVRTVAGSRPRCTPHSLKCAAPTPCAPAAPPPLILEHYQLRRWLYAGAGRLGDDSRLWAASIVNRSQLGANAQVGVTQTIATPDPLRDPFHVDAHRMSVFVPASVQQTPALERAMALLLKTEVPADVVVDLHYVAPRFRVGQQAMLGLDSVVARTPSGVHLANPNAASSRPNDPLQGAQPLGQGTLLGSSSNNTTPRAGASRVGAGMVLR